jgi:hypothetical protein
MEGCGSLWKLVEAYGSFLKSFQIRSRLRNKLRIVESLGSLFGSF